MNSMSDEMAQFFPSDATPSSDEVNLLLDTVKDYSSQLRSQIVAIRKAESAISSLVGATSGVVSIFAVMLAILSSSGAVSSGSEWRIAIAASAALSFIAVFVAIGNRFLTLRYSRDERKRLTIILLQLFRRASQLQDRGNLPFSQRILFDIVLADAESLLRGADRNRISAA